jgi:hypothetical protein
MAAALAVGACSHISVVNTGDFVPTATTAPPRPTLPADDANLVNAHDYAAGADTQAGYYFTTPSGRWRCTILARLKAGCQAASGSDIGIAGEPKTVSNAADQSVAPNTIVVDFDGDAHFAWVDRAEFSSPAGAPKALPFNKVLAAAGFRCNVAESGVSCASESTGNGFTFSAEGYTLQYTDVPAGAR